MTNKVLLKKKIIYRSCHRGNKEMDLLLGNFVKKHLDELTDKDLKDLEKILLLEDEVILNWYFKKESEVGILKTKVSTMILNFKI